MFSPTSPFSSWIRFAGSKLGCALAALVFVTDGSVRAQTSGTVTTIGGAFEGFADGDNQVSQFRTPTGLALDASDNLFIADYGNNAVRVMRLSDQVVSTYAHVTGPIAVAVDRLQNLYVAAQGNGSLLKFDSFGNLRGTVLGGLVQPTAVTTDTNGSVYVAEAGGVVHRLDTNGVPALYRSLGRGSVFRGVAVMQDGRLAVSDSGTEVIWLFDGPGDNPHPIAGTLNTPGFADGPLDVARFNQPFQIAAGPNNSIVVADRFNHRIRLVGCDGMTRTLFGVDSSKWETGPPNSGIFPGWLDGPVSFVESRDPYGVAVSGQGTVYDTEVYYHLVRQATGLAFPGPCGVQTNGTNIVIPLPVFTPNSGFYPNGVDITVTATNGAAFGPLVHVYYTLNGTEPGPNNTTGGEVTLAAGKGVLHLPGPIDLAGLKIKAVEGDNSSATVSALPTIVPAPILTPNSGYYPMGVRVNITSTNGFPEGVQLFYTLNGTEPTTNSAPVLVENGQRFIIVRDAGVDLRSLKVKAFWGPNVGTTVSGQPVSFADSSLGGQLGIAPPLNGDRFFAGIGSTIVLPVVVNMKAGQTLKSLQFVVEVGPKAGAVALASKAQFRVLPISSNDFIQVISATTSSPTTNYNITSTSAKVAVAFVGPDTGFVVNNFAVVAMLGIQFRAGAGVDEGDEYSIRVSNISATSDGVQKSVSLAALPTRTIQLSNIPYMLGDTSPASWYNAGDFGDRVLDNSDVNNALFASLGFRVPYDFSDAFDAMDAYPPPSTNIAGGDGSIRLLDWLTILRRAIGFDPDMWARVRGTDGLLHAFPTNAIMPEQSVLARQSAGNAWSRDALLSAGVAERVIPGGSARVPLMARVDAGKRITALQFVAYVQPEGVTPGVNGVKFTPAAGVPAPTLTGNNPPGAHLDNGAYVVWQNFDPGLSGTVTLGVLEFTAPDFTITGQHYTIFCDAVSGAGEDESGAQFQPEFETMRGAAWIDSNAQSLPDSVPDEWKMHFFGSLAAPEAQGGADPDHDGLSNMEEWKAGSNPATSDWRFRIANDVFTLRWAGESGHSYSVERRPADSNTWTRVASSLQGADGFLEYSEKNVGSAKAYFYRVRRE